MKKEEFLNKLQIELKISKNSEHTIKNYLHANYELLNFLNKEPEQIKEEDVKFFLAEKFSKKSSMSAILFLSAIKYAYSNLLKNDITKNIKRPKREKKIPDVLTKEEVRKLLSSIPTKKSKLMCSLIYACGFRVSELVNLKINDLNFEERSGYVRQGKGKKDRFFNIPSFLQKKLEKQAENQQKLGKDYLFTGPKGKLTDRNLQKIIKKSAQKAMIKKNIHPHTLRHSFATHLLDEGVNIRIIQELLGHSNLSTTQIYTHISSEQLKKVKSPLDSL